jgi:hypothetical protein
VNGAPAAVLDPDPSAALRDKLLIELGTLTSADIAATWAGDALAAKNSLTATDAKLVEEAFERTLSTCRRPIRNRTLRTPFAIPNAGAEDSAATEKSGNDGIEKSVSRLRHHAAIATRAPPDMPAWFVRENPAIPTTCALPNRAPWASKCRMSSRCRSAAFTTAPYIAPAMSKRGGTRPASTRPRSHASFGRRRVASKRTAMLGGPWSHRSHR